MGTIYRFADFFSVKSLTYTCANQVSLFDEALTYVRVGTFWPITAFNDNLSELLATLYPTLWHCAFAWLTELNDPSTYVEFSDASKTLQTIHHWVVQD